MEKMVLFWGFSCNLTSAQASINICGDSSGHIMTEVRIDTCEVMELLHSKQERRVIEQHNHHIPHNEVSVQLNTRYLDS